MIQVGERNPVLDHVWGVSPAEDRIWAQVAGLAPSTKPWERLFVVFQAYIDDSVTNNGTFVLGGYIASVESWAAFSKAWEPLLPLFSTRSNTGKYRFKMSEMTMRMADVRIFYEVIEQHAAFKVACKITIPDLKRAIDRIWIERTPIIHGDWSNPYFVCFRGLMDLFHQARFDERTAKVIPIEQKMDFYFDAHTSSKAIHSAWNEYLQNRPQEVKEMYGNEPRFEDDEEFLPLQAADFWAWWVRPDLNSRTRFRMRDWQKRRG
jgi:hypothetical protein